MQKGKNMGTVDFPIGEILIGVSVLENTDFQVDEIRLDQVKLFFQNTAITLRSLPDTDEVEITQEPVDSFIKSDNTPSWCKQFLGKMLQTAWICENAQNYQDQVILAFEFMTPTLAFLAEGSALNVLRFEKIRKADSSKSVASVNSQKDYRQSIETEVNENQKLVQVESDFEFNVSERIETPDNLFTIEGEIYMVQRRPMHPHVVMNDKYQGIQVLDPWRGTDIFKVSFTGEYDSSGMSNGWCFRADGKAVLVLNEETRNACLLSLEAEGSSYSLKSPPLREITDLRYVWENDSFWLTGGKSFAYFNLQWHDGEPLFVERGGIYARKEHRAWCQALDQIQVLSSQVLRVEPDKAQMIYYDSSKHPETIGVLSWCDKTKWSVPAVRYVPVMAFHKEYMFLMYEHEVHAINQQGMVVAIYNTPEGFYGCGLDTLPSQDTYPAALVLACSSLSEPKHSQILVYRLDD